MTTRRLLTLGAAVTAALVALGGSALAFSGAGAPRTGTDDAVTTTATTTPTTTTFPLPSPAATIDRSAAEQAALAHVGGGTISHHTERETEHGLEFWKVEVTDAGVTHTLYVDTTTGAVTERGTATRSAGASRTAGATPTGSAGVDDKGGLRANDDSGRHGGADDSGRHGGDDRSGRHGGSDDGPNHDCAPHSGTGQGR
ncbi:PepSY domain-containing protein [Pseudonocardia sp. T1-2H]|uniref:PepSY domain-containing protein n=1 Tax=Pseudonocardia sp. T1-2H TaxID=3128899 RepID=UPI0031011C82